MVFKISQKDIQNDELWHIFVVSYIESVFNLDYIDLLSRMEAEKLTAEYSEILYDLA